MLDFYDTQSTFSPEQRQTRAAARKYLESEVLPHITGWFEEGTLPDSLAAAFGEMGFFGANLPTEYGCAGLDNVAYGLLMYELERIDSGLRSFASVQGALVMYPIYAYGTEKQRQHYLPRLASGELVGCFGLTESDGGSDPGAMKTRARKEGDRYILNGSKMWITNGNIADIAVVWAKCEDDVVRGFLVPTGSKGFQANKVKHKMSLRASITSELVLKDVCVPAENLLPGVEGLKGPLGCLTQARYGIAWGALGALEAVYTEALDFAQSRVTFDRPIAGRQLVQHKLVEMLGEHTKGLLLAHQLGRLKDAGDMNYVQVSLAKRNNVRVALQGARLAREILGGSGITLEYHSIRHMLNLETVDTYEGTYDIHTLIVGRDITGIGALE
ncbi:MAG TPA: acyl-CoA dehydrogenase family protein [Trueperaceae bacterium]